MDQSQRTQYTDNLPENISADDVFKILVATDIHLGYLEKDPERGEDTFNTFEEILQLAVNSNVDFILLGGDLFHENKPSMACSLKCLNLLRKYCLGDRPVSIEYRSDPAVDYKDSFDPIVNYEDPNVNISMPVFSIHGNHDDPTGFGGHSVMDLLSVNRLVNYFGKWNDLGEIKVSPVLLKKGSSNVALFGLSSVRDERLYHLFREEKVTFLRPKESPDDWFNIFVLHQNRVKHSPTTYVPDTFLDDFLDLIIWGHEHECLINPEWNTRQMSYISQPGSSVATSLCGGESKEKHVGVLEIYHNTFKMAPIKLRTVRPFIFDDLSLADADRDSQASNAAEKTEEYVEEYVEEMIEKSKKLLTKHPKQPTLPLVRLRIEYVNQKETFNIARFGQKFMDKVANVDDMILFKKHRLATDKKTFDMDKLAVESALQIDYEALWEIRVETLVENYFNEAKDDSKKLEVLSEKGMAVAVGNFIDKDNKDAICEIVSHQIKKTCEYLKERDVTENNFVGLLQHLREERGMNAEHESTEAQEWLNKSVRMNVTNSITEDTRDLEMNADVISDIDDDSPPSNRGRGGKRGGGRGSKGRGKATSLDDDSPPSTTRGKGKVRAKRTSPKKTRGQRLSRGSSANASNRQTTISESFTRSQQFNQLSSQRPSSQSVSKKIVYDISDSDD